MCRLIPFLVLVSGVFGLGIPATGALTQTRTAELSVQTPPGQEVRVGIFVNIRTDCTDGPLPGVRVSQLPQHGDVYVKSGKLHATNYQKCSTLDVPALLAFYRSEPDFNGTDTFVLEVKASNGTVKYQHIEVHSMLADKKPVTPDGNRGCERYPNLC